ncbi:hypothetical protein HY008_03100 [Candidatus Woesebacteria bacterium]|nr:hypothetical protein [Candidatus Woesebacteria bacterium]
MQIDIHCGELEAETNIWTFCSIGLSGSVPQGTPFSDGSCPGEIAGLSPTSTPTLMPTNTPPPTSTPAGSTLTPSPTPSSTWGGIFITSGEVKILPASGSAWNAVVAAANTAVSSPNLNIRNSDNTNTYAKSLVYVRTGDKKYADEVRQILGKIMGTESGSDVLAVLRNTYAYVIAADLINLKNFDPAFDSTFRSWLLSMRTASSSGPCSSIIDCHEKRPNNFGAHALSSRVAIARYIGDTTDLAKAIDIHKAWLGLPGFNHNFNWGSDLSWQCDSSNPVGINPKGCTKSGHDIDGVLPDDQRRSGSFTWPPFCENYVWGALNGFSVGTEMLRRAGHPAWEWADQAINRSLVWLHSASVKSTNWCAATGDDAWVPILVNYTYGTNFPGSVTSVGKGLGFTGWTHAK